MSSSWCWWGPITLDRTPTSHWVGFFGTGALPRFLWPCRTRAAAFGDVSMAAALKPKSKPLRPMRGRRKAAPWKWRMFTLRMTASGVEASVTVPPFRADSGSAPSLRPHQLARPKFVSATAQSRGRFRVPLAANTTFIVTFKTDRSFSSVVSSRFDADQGPRLKRN